MSESKAANESLLAALGPLPSGIYIVTIGQDAEATGMLASWIQQAGFDPPSVSLAIKQGRPISERLESGEPFVVNVLAEGQFDLLKHFSKGFEPGVPAFEGVETHSTGIGVPALSKAVAVLECQATSAAEAGDHRVVVAKVTAGERLGDQSPMVHIRKRGDHY